MAYTTVSWYVCIHITVQPFSFFHSDKSCISSDNCTVVKGNLFWGTYREKTKLFSKEKTHINFERHAAACRFFFHCLWNVCVPGMYPAETELPWDALTARHISAAGHNLCSLNVPLLATNSFQLVVTVQQPQWTYSTSSGHSRGSFSWQELGIFDFPLQYMSVSIPLSCPYSGWI